MKEPAIIVTCASLALLALYASASIADTYQEQPIPTAVLEEYDKFVRRAPPLHASSSGNTDDIRSPLHREMVELTVLDEPRFCKVCHDREEKDAVEDEADAQRNRANGMARQGINRNGTELTIREQRLLWEIAGDKHLDSLVITPKAFHLMDKMIDNQFAPGWLREVDNSDFSAETRETLKKARQLVNHDLSAWKAELFLEFNWQ